MYASNFGEETLGKEWAEDGNREERLKLKQSSELQGTVRSDWWTHFPSEAVASAVDQVKHLLVQNGKSASSFQGPEHDPSQNKQPSVLDTTKLCFRWWLSWRKTDDYWKHTCDAVDRLKSFWAQGLLHVSVHAFVVTLDLPTEFQLVSICKIQNRILLNALSYF